MKKEVGAPQKAPTPAADSLPVLNSNGDCNASWRDRLRALEERIVANEGDSIQARWEFGNELLKLRVGKQLPNGLIAEIVKTRNISRAEINHRMRFAERCPTAAEVATAVDTYQSWSQIRRRVLPDNPRPPQPKPSPHTFVKRYNFQLSQLDRAAANLEKLHNDEVFSRYVDELRREHRDEEHRPGIVWRHNYVTKVIDRVLDELTTVQPTLFDDEGVA
jgi:hypothetical protein